MEAKKDQKKTHNLDAWVQEALKQLEEELKNCLRSPDLETLETLCHESVERGTEKFEEMTKGICGECMQHHKEEEDHIKPVRCAICQAEPPEEDTFELCELHQALVGTIREERSRKEETDFDLEATDDAIKIKTLDGKRQYR